MSLFTEYVAYLKDNPNGYWFKPKLYGFGWTPATKQGWLVLGVYLFFVVGVTIGIEIVTVTPSVVEVLLPVATATVLLLVITIKTGEPLKWQWGKSHGK